MADLPATRARFPFRLGAPSARELSDAVRDHGDMPYSYEAVGGTAGDLPVGWAHDDETLELGRGQEVWDRARVALRRWSQFDLGWVRMADPDAPIQAGQIVAFASNQLGFWALNVCRIAYVVDDDDGTTARFGFAYGTLADHVVQGEERFLLTWDHASDRVAFRITKFSRPAHRLVHLFSPLATAVQRRFTRQALERLKAEVAA
ncbi:MAG: DUF1990 domain-containing protein [Alphaproteobacteria bacterium]|nr:DUF1990 domain-containing protein [Alphaproteobacteria bacterium]MCB9694473.1 DUF1990 domain-containing protein [Alphaproteobacteria bacterium]